MDQIHGQGVLWLNCFVFMVGQQQHLKQIQRVHQYQLMHFRQSSVQRTHVDNVGQFIDLPLGGDPFVVQTVRQQGWVELSKKQFVQAGHDQGVDDGGPRDARSTTNVGQGPVPFDAQDPRIVRWVLAQRLQFPGFTGFAVHVPGSGDSKETVFDGRGGLLQKRGAESENGRDFRLFGPQDLKIATERFGA